MARPPLSPCGEIVRTHDPDRFFTALFAPPEHRETLFTLYAFNHELARAREAVREPFAALIRLQWWREVVEGARRRHEVAEPLGVALAEGRLLAADLAVMVDSREAETESIETMVAFEDYLEGTAGTLMVAAARAMGMAEPGRLRRPGAAYGALGLLRNAPGLARQGRCLLPQSMIEGAGTAELVDPASPDFARVRSTVRPLAARWLAARPTVPRSALAAALPLVLTRRDLKRRGEPVARGTADRLAVVAAAMLGRV